MYTTSWCGYCFRLKRILTTEGIPFAEVDIEADQRALLVEGIERRLVARHADAKRVGLLNPAEHR